MGWMGLDRQLGFGESVRREWISGSRMLVGVWTPIFHLIPGLTCSIGFPSQDFKNWVSEVAEYGEGGCGGE